MKRVVRNRLCVNRSFSSIYCDRFSSELDWNLISKTQIFSEDTIRKYHDKLEWRYILERHVLSDELLEDCCTKYLDIINSSIMYGRYDYRDYQYKNIWEMLLMCRKQPLKESFIEKYIDEFRMMDILYLLKVSSNFIKKHAPNFDSQEWKYVCRYQVVNEEIIREYPDKVDWEYLFRYQNHAYRIISESLIIEHMKYIDHREILLSLVGKYPLSESFIDKYINKLPWEDLIRCQKLSEQIIRKNIHRFKNKSDWTYLVLYQTLSLSFREEIHDKLYKIGYFKD